MIGKILGAMAGAKAAEQTSKFGGAGGALLGVAAATVLRRLSFPALVVLTAGGYALKKLNDRAQEPSAPDPAPAAAKKPARKPRKAPVKAPSKAANAA